MADNLEDDDDLSCDPETGEPYVNRNELARAFKVTEPAFARWVADGCPCVEKGANGRRYKFLISQVRAWRAEQLGRDKADAEARLSAVLQ